MHDFFFADNAGWFTIPAVLGTIFFSIRLLIMMVGGHAGDLSLDVDHGGDLHHGDPGDAFKLLSAQSIAAFLMGFGWGGVGALRATDWSYPTATAVAVACGIGMVWLLGILLKLLFDLQSSGNISLDSTVGAEGDVYVSVPPRGEGRGQVRLVIGDRQRIFNAVSGGDAINSYTRVRVQHVNDDNTVTVAPT
ncbi:MAG: hypothetical protein L0Y44_12030 [Phycisphaerales bacterium]|nr:hypothetical protein [Phycisphaerales bacterium]MCI0631368.1 hypothetical protein [Phycisphaerales bacterium]